MSDANTPAAPRKVRPIPAPKPAPVAPAPVVETEMEQELDEAQNGTGAENYSGETPPMDVPDPVALDRAEKLLKGAKIFLDALTADVPNIVSMSRIVSNDTLVKMAVTLSDLSAFSSLLSRDVQEATATLDALTSG